MQDLKILIVEDELVTVEMIREVLESRGYNIIGAVDKGQDALAMIEKDRPDLILMDIRIKGDIDGIDLAVTIGERYQIPVIYLTAFADRKTVERAKLTESYGYLIKPFGETELITNIEIAFHKHKLDFSLRESEKRYRTLFESMSDAVYIHDGGGRFVEFNPSMERLTGLSRHELLSVNIRDLFLDEEAWVSMNKMLVACGQVEDVHAVLRGKDGGTVRCIISARRTVGVNRCKETIHGVIRDVTEQWMAQKKLEEERAFTDAVIDSMPAIFYAVDSSGRFMRWNRKLEELSGLEGDSMRDISLMDLMNEHNRELFKHKLNEGFSRGEVMVEAGLRMRGGDDSRRDFMITGRRVEIDGGEYMVGAGVDISGRKEMEEALRRSEEKYRMLVENINDVIFMLDNDGVITYISPALEQISHYTTDEVVGEHFRNLVHPDDLPGLASRFARTLSGDIESFEFRVKDKDGSVRHVRTSSRTITIGGAVTGIIGLMVDVTDRKRMEEAMRESEIRYRAIFDGSLNQVYIYDFQGRFIDANDAALQLLGYGREDITSLTLADLLPEDQLEWARDRIGAMMRSGEQSRTLEYCLKTRSGGLRYVEASASLLYREGTPYAILGVARDITERKRYLDELKNVHADNIDLLNSIASILIGVSVADVITHWNHMAERIFGIPASEALGKKITGYTIDWQWDEIYIGISSCITGNCPVNLSDIRYRDKNGRKGLLGITINPIVDENKVLKGFLIYGKDITERRIVEQQLLQSSKMATVGEMATGVAHELNQPLNVIKTASQYLMDGLNEKYANEDFIRERVQKIVAQVDRAAHIINHLREFGRKSDYDFNLTDPNLPIRVAFDMMGEQLRVNNIGFILELAEDLPLVNGDLHKLEQVFINLIVNAKDAMLESKNPLQEKNIMVKSFRDQETGDVLIRFGDTGPGIPIDIKDRIFEPFFTTKEVGKGTGLGLSISYGIVKAHRGTINIIPENGGAAFTIRLPAPGVSGNTGKEE